MHRSNDCAAGRGSLNSYRELPARVHRASVIEPFLRLWKVYSWVSLFCGSRQRRAPFHLTGSELSGVCCSCSEGDAESSQTRGRTKREATEKRLVKTSEKKRFCATSRSRLRLGFAIIMEQNGIYIMKLIALVKILNVLLQQAKDYVPVHFFPTCNNLLLINRCTCVAVKFSQISLCFSSLGYKLIDRLNTSVAAYQQYERTHRYTSKHSLLLRISLYNGIRDHHLPLLAHHSILPLLLQFSCLSITLSLLSHISFTFAFRWL